MKYGSVLLQALAAVLFFSLAGCKKDGGPDRVQVMGDMYPLIHGSKTTYNGYIRAAGADTNITATGAYYNARMTVLTSQFPALPSYVAPLAGTTFFISDSSLVNPAPTWVARGFHVKRSSATSGDIWFLTDIGRFYRQTAINVPGNSNSRIDSLKWVRLVRQDAFLNEPWDAFDSTYTSLSPTVGTARLKVECNFEAEETITVNGQTFNTYRLVARRTVYVGGSPTPIGPASPTATLWLVPGTGIVKFIFNSDPEVPGFERHFLSKSP